MPDLLLIFSFPPAGGFFFSPIFMENTIKFHCGNRIIYIVYKNMVDFTKDLCYNVYNSCEERTASPDVAVKIFNEVNILAEQNNNQKPIVNPFLVKAMETMKQERTQQSEYAFINAMKAARFLVPANISTVQQAQANENGTVELKEQPQVRFLLFSNAEGKKYFPIFTDATELQKWEKHNAQQVAAVSFRDLCQILEKNPGGEAVGAVINPFSHNVLVPTSTLEQIQRSEAIAPGTKIQVGTLKEEPTPLLDGLRPYLESNPVINKAYLRVMKREDKENPNFLLVIDVPTDLSEPEIKSLFDGIAEAAKPNMRGVELAIVPAHNQFGAAALKDAEPFYVKEA